MVNAASDSGVAISVELPTAVEAVREATREWRYNAVIVEESAATTSAAAAAITHGTRQNAPPIPPARDATTFSSRRIADRIFDHASAGGSIDFGRSMARSRIRLRLSTSALQIAQIETCSATGARASSLSSPVT